MIEALPWEIMSRFQRDAAYDNAAAVEQREKLVRARNEQAMAFRNAHPAWLDIPYGELERNKWDLYPAANTAAPCMIFIHGGYWQMNRREDFAGLAEGVTAHGWSAAMPGHTLAPEANLSGIITELHAAFEAFARNRSEYGILGDCYLCGWSAGGQLTAIMLNHPLIKAGLAISGIFELGPLRDTYLNDKLRLTDDDISKFSPMRLSAVQKPLAIAYGTGELPALIKNSRNFHAHRAGQHADGPLLPIPHANHFDVLDELRSADGKLTRWLLDQASTPT